MDRAFAERMAARLRAVADEQRALREALGSGLAVEMTASVGELSSVDQHSSDLANETLERQKDLGLLAQAERTLELCAEALRRIEAGTYGTCDACGAPIPKSRLEALPFALKCVACQEAEDAERSFFRPAEEDVLHPPFAARAAYGEEQIDRDDAWEIVARHGNANSPQDAPEAYDDDDDAAEKGNG